MNKTVKKILQFFVGIFYIGRDKTKSVVGTMKKEGVFDETESRQVARTAMKGTTKQVKKTSKQVKKTVESLRKKDQTSNKEPDAAVESV